MSDPSPDRCADCKARPSWLFGSLSGRHLERLERELTSHTFQRGQIIFYTGAPAHAMYIVCTGRVRIFLTAHGGQEQVVRLLGPGECFGYRALAASEPYRASAQAVEDARLCVVPATVLRELLREVPSLSLGLLAKLARELSTSEGLMMDLLHRPVRQRAARLLLHLLADNRGATDPAVLHSRHLRRQDMARMIGTTPETFSRVLRGFAQRGIVAVSRDRIRIRNDALLHKVAGDRASP